MNIDQAHSFLDGLCGNSIFGNQVYHECIGRLFEVGYSSYKGEVGTRSGEFVNDFNEKSLTNHYNKIIRTYE